MALLILAACPDPKLAKARASLAPFSSSTDGTFTTSVSGFALLLHGEPVVLTTAAAIYALLPLERRRADALAAACQADLVPGARVTALVDSSSRSGSGSAAGIELRLVGVAEAPGLRAALRSLLAAPSLVGPGGWQVGWLMHRSGPPAADVLAVASHVAVLRPASTAGAAALRACALAPPAAAGGGPLLRQGQALTAVGAPFGRALAPQHFSSFLARGLVSAAVPSSSDSSLSGDSFVNSWSTVGNAGSSSSSSSGGDGGGCSDAPALVLADMRCAAGMEGCPVLFADPAAGLGSSSHGQLAGMLLPPVKASAAAVEFAAVAPTAAVLAAAEAALASSAGSGSLSRSDASGGAAAAQGLLAAPAAAAGGSSVAAAEAALHSVVAVVAAGSWASGVLVSDAGHILTNAHLLVPSGPGPGPDPAPAPPSSQSRPQLQLLPAAAASPQPAQHAPVQVRLPAAAGGTWAVADVLHVFSGPLDLAVLQLRAPVAASHQKQQQQRRRHAWRPLALSQHPPRPGQPVLVLGFPAFNPRSTPLGGPVVTGGCLAKVVCLPSSGSPAMLLTTAAVHSGTSGGAVVDAASGRLLGLVTSNGKHTYSTPSSGGGGTSGSGGDGGAVTVLPCLNFSLPAAQLLPAVEAAVAASACGGGSGSNSSGRDAAVAAWRALDAATAADAELRQAWSLDRRQQQQQRQQQLQVERSGFGGARPPAGLVRLLKEAQREEAQQPRARL